MLITESQLRKVIRAMIIECYGWPVEKEIVLYGIEAKQEESPVDPKNVELKLPKGLNTRSSVNDG